MIGSDDYLITKTGLSKAEEIEPGSITLGVRSGSLAWSTIDKVQVMEAEALRIFGDQSEFTLFENTFVMTSSGPARPYIDITTSIIYKIPHKLETVPLFSSHLEKEWSRDNVKEGSWYSELDFRVLGFFTRRLPFTSRLVIRLPKKRFSNISYVFPPTLKPSLYEGDIWWDWLKLESVELLTFVNKYWTVPDNIPRIIRHAGMQKLNEFMRGAMLAFTEEGDSGLLFRSFENERDIRLLLCLWFSLGNQSFELVPYPLYNPDKVTIELLKEPITRNSVRTAKYLTRASGVKINSPQDNWYPIVNLSMLY